MIDNGPAPNRDVLFLQPDSFYFRVYSDFTCVNRNFNIRVLACLGVSQICKYPNIVVCRIK